MSVFISLFPLSLSLSLSNSISLCTVKPEYSDQLWDSKKLAVVQRRPLLGGSKNENDKQQVVHADTLTSQEQMIPCHELLRARLFFVSDMICLIYTKGFGKT